MGKRAIFLLLAISLVLGPVSCTQLKPEPVARPTAVIPVEQAGEEPVLDQPTATPEPQATDTPLPTGTPTATSEPPTPSPVPTEAPEAKSEEGAQVVAIPVLLGPPTGYTGSLVDLNWAWEPGLGDAEQYQLDIWTNEADAEPAMYGLYDEPHVRLTSANLMPGNYLWRASIVPVADGAVVATMATVNEPESFSIQRPSLLRGQARAMDFGDAPEEFYNTLLKDDGARHYVGGLYMGALVDVEADGQPDLAAMGDDDAGDSDEDGVEFDGLLTQCQQVSVTITSSGDGYVDAWLDLNADGYWDEKDEQVLFSEAVVAGENELTFSVACDAEPTFLTYIRFRLSSRGGLKPWGLALDGEVEDYAVAIEESELTPTPTLQPTVAYTRSPDGTATPAPTATQVAKPTPTSEQPPYNPPPATDEPDPTDVPYTPPEDPTEVPTAVPTQEPEPTTEPYEPPPAEPTAVPDPTSDPYPND